MDKHTDDTRNAAEYPVTIDQLQPGVYIRITGLAWRDHPFLMSAFKVSSKEQINALRRLRIATVFCVPGRSDALPLPIPENPPSAPADTRESANDAATESLWQEKKERMAKQQVLRKKINACQKQFSASVETVKNVMQNVESGRLESVRDADSLLQSIIDDLVTEKETAVQLMNTGAGSDETIYHSLNVSVLSMMLGRKHGLGPDDLRVLGLGALFHDIGKHRVPKKILLKPSPLTKFEKDILRLHPRYGVETMKSLSGTDAFPAGALGIIRDHHERVNGSGYPKGIAGNRLSELTKIVSIVNRYDNLCNNRNPEKAITPHEALAHMFKSEGERFDSELLQRFIAFMGVYPPGTIVRLTNGAVGMVISVNPEHSLKPDLLIYDPEVPQNEALIFDLTVDQSLSIETSLRPHDLPEAVHDYLNPRVRVSYYLSAQERRRTDSSRKQ